MVNSHLEQIQSLIAEIEGVLQQPSPRLPWMGETARDSRRVLERVRTYLQEQEQQVAAELSLKETKSRPSLLAGDIQPEGVPSSLEGIDPAFSASAGQILQAVEREIGTLRSNLIQPLLSDMQALQSERDSLIREIRQLEGMRQHQSTLAQQSAYQQQIISEFLQTLMGRLQESLTQQVTQTLANLKDQFLSYESQRNYSHPPLEATQEADSLSYVPIWDPSSAYGQVSGGHLDPRDRVRSLQMLEARIDQMIGTLDSTVSVVFEALLQNVRGHSESLSSGIEKMHSLGQQGEMMFGQLVAHLAQKLGQEAAGILQSSLPMAELEPAAQKMAEPTPAIESVEPPIPPKQERASTGRTVRSKNAQTAHKKKDVPAAGAREKESSEKLWSAGQQEAIAPKIPDISSVDALNLQNLPLSLIHI